MAKLSLNKGPIGKVTGLDELAKNIETLAKTLGAEPVKTILMEEAAIPMRDKAKELVPVDSGVLKQNIIATYGKSKGDEIDVLAGVRYGTGGGNHAHLVDYGTSKMTALPFWRPAVDATKNEAGERVAAKFKEIIESVGE